MSVVDETVVVRVVPVEPLRVVPVPWMIGPFMVRSGDSAAGRGPSRVGAPAEGRTGLRMMMGGEMFSVSV